MKKQLLVIPAICLALALAACGGTEASGKQTATAYLDQAEEAVLVTTVDLTGGWSVEYARGAVYLYDREIVEGEESIAMLISLDKEVYEDHLANAMADESHKEADGGIYYLYDEGEGGYLASIEDAAYVLITGPQDGLEEIVARFQLTLE